MKFKALTTLVLLFAGSSHAQQSNNQYFQEQQRIQNQNHAAEQNRQGYMTQQQQMQQPQQLPPQPTGYWEKTWGAIAPSPVGGVLGTATGASSKEEAERLALADCEAKGGGACQIELAYHNQCAVMTLGDKFLGSAHAVSVERATEIGIAGCQKTDTNCRVYYSACTEPIFHKY